MSDPESELEVLYEDNHLLVVNKPPLLATMGVEQGQDSLVNRAKAYIKRRHAKPGNVYLGIVSRLDSFTSGIVVFAKTSKAAARLNKQFLSRQVQKKYLAIVRGNTPEEARWTDYLLKNEAQHRMQAVTKSHPLFADAKKAELELVTLHADDSNSLVDIRLLTGRKHQIRVQFASRGIPILGDRKYDSNDHFSKGIALHAYCLSFEHPVQERRVNIVKLPPETWPFSGIIRRRLRHISRDPGTNI